VICKIGLIWASAGTGRRSPRTPPASANFCSPSMRNPERDILGFRIDPLPAPAQALLLALPLGCCCCSPASFSPPVPRPGPEPGGWRTAPQRLPPTPALLHGMNPTARGRQRHKGFDSRRSAMLRFSLSRSRLGGHLPPGQNIHQRRSHRADAAMWICGAGGRKVLLRAERVDLHGRSASRCWPSPANGQAGWFSQPTAPSRDPAGGASCAISTSRLEETWPYSLGGGAPGQRC